MVKFTYGVLCAIDAAGENKMCLLDVQWWPMSMDNVLLVEYRVSYFERKFLDEYFWVGFY